MRRTIFAIALSSLALLGIPGILLAQDESGGAEYMRAKVLTIVSEEEEVSPAGETMIQKVTIELLSGTERGKTVSTEYITNKASFERQKLERGDIVVVGKTTDIRGDVYDVMDVFRLPMVGLFFLVFFVLAAVFGRGSGARAVIGLGVSLLILLTFVVPGIFGGGNPVLLCALGSAAIAIISILLSHGLRMRSFVALGATLFALMLAFVLSALAVSLAALSGSGTEEAIVLQLNFFTDLDLQGLLLGGMVIGTLGVLDDVTTTQTATVEEIHNANDTLDVQELYRRGISVGQEHIASLVNTLALAYVGASFPLFLLFALPDGPPLWVLLNSEQIMEEAVRALVGGASLILAVPLATLFAAYIFSRRPVKHYD